MKKYPTRCNNVPDFIIPYLYEAQHVSGDTTSIIRSLKLHWQPLVFHTWKVVWTCSWWILAGTTCLHVQTTFHVWKTRGCQCSFRLVMRGGVSPETCWASYKYGIIKFWYIVAFLHFFFMNCTMMHGSTNVKFTSNCLVSTLCIQILNYLCTEFLRMNTEQPCKPWYGGIA